MEIEAKIKLKSPSRLRALLNSAEAECKGIILEKNWLYDYPDRALTKGDKMLRIRQDKRIRMTFKGPRGDSEYKSREEVEVEFPELGGASSFIESIGFVKWFYYERYRETWELDRCEIVLDELPFLGLYVEIEGSEEQDVTSAIKRLKLPRRYTSDTYIELLLEHSGGNIARAHEFKFPSEHEPLLTQEKKRWR